MNYKDALQLYHDFQFLIGKKGKYTEHAISDILILPSGNEKAVLDRILSGQADGAIQVTAYKENGEYAVVVLFNIGANYLFQDISLYTYLRQ